MSDFITGFKYAFSGFKLIVQPGIRAYVFIPLLVNVLLFISVIAYSSNNLSDLLSGWWGWTSWIIWPLFAVFCLSLIFFCFTIAANLIAAPFNGFLAKAVESKLSNMTLNNTDELKIIKAIRSEIGKFLYLIVWALPLFLLSIIPVVQIIASFLWLLFGAWMLALEYIDYPMANHGIIFPEQRRIMAMQKKQTFGFGLGVMLLTFTPIINFIAMPIAVAGASKMWADKLKSVLITNF